MRSQITTIQLAFREEGCLGIVGWAKETTHTLSVRTSEEKVGDGNIKLGLFPAFKYE